MITHYYEWLGIFLVLSVYMHSSRKSKNPLIKGAGSCAGEGRREMMRIDNEFFLERVFEKTASIFAPLAKVTGAELVFVPSADLPDVCKADASLVLKLINGLLSQAIFFRDGEVRMDAFVVNGSPLIRPADAQCVHLRIVVTSTPLIFREQGPHILLRDQKPMIEIIDKIRTSLDDCNDLARMLGGNVQISDASEVGLSISADIVLGVPDSQPQVLALSTSLEPGRKVLVIDDNASARIIMTELLHRLGLESLSASSLEAAANLVLREPSKIGVVFVDGDLVSGEARPAMLSSGVALEPGVPVVVMDFGGVSECSTVPQSQCFNQIRLLKPVTRNALHNALERAFECCMAESGLSSDAACADSQAFFGLRALVVDDNAFNLEVFESILTMAGMQVAKAKSGMDALTALERDPGFDVVLMDMQMPEMDGCETTRRIRANPRLRGLPVLALTANAAPGAREQCLASGMNDFLTKPVETPAMFRALSRWILRRP
jgi:two-component system sensor histidine kinase/response regulator